MAAEAASNGQGSGSGVSSEQAERFEADLKAKKAAVRVLCCVALCCVVLRCVVLCCVVRAARAGRGCAPHTNVPCSPARTFCSPISARNSSQIGKLETELRDSRASVAKLKALQSSGPSEADSIAASQARSDEMAALTKRSKEQDLEVEELKEKLQVSQRTCIQSL